MRGIIERTGSKVEINALCKKFRFNDSRAARLVRSDFTIFLQFRNLKNLIHSIYSDTTDKNNLARYQEKLVELKTEINYVEPQKQKLLKSRKNDDNSETILKEIRQLNSAKYNKELRKELFDGDDNSGLRKRGNVIYL